MADVGVLLEDQLAGPALVGRVHEAEQEHHGDRLGAELAEPADAGPDRLLVEGQQHLALVVDALGDRGCGPGARAMGNGAG